MLITGDGTEVRWRVDGADAAGAPRYDLDREWDGRIRQSWWESGLRDEARRRMAAHDEGLIPSPPPSPSPLTAHRSPLTFHPHPTPPPTPHQVLSNAFALIYFGEFCIKISGLGPRQYFRDKWNLFDFFLVLVQMGTSAGTALTYFLGGAHLTLNLSYIRSLRVLRLARYSRSVRHPNPNPSPTPIATRARCASCS